LVAGLAAAFFFFLGAAFFFAVGFFFMVATGMPPEPECTERAAYGSELRSTKLPLRAIGKFIRDTTYGIPDFFRTLYPVHYLATT
jgi:hypothetical protein